MGPGVARGEGLHECHEALVRRSGPDTCLCDRGHHAVGRQVLA